MRKSCKLSIAGSLTRHLVGQHIIDISTSPRLFLYPNIDIILNHNRVQQVSGDGKIKFYPRKFKLVHRHLMKIIKCWWLKLCVHSPFYLKGITYIPKFVACQVFVQNFIWYLSPNNPFNSLIKSFRILNIFFVYMTKIKYSQTTRSTWDTKQMAGQTWPSKKYTKIYKISR